MNRNRATQNLIIGAIFLLGLMAIGLIYYTNLSWAIWMLPIWVGSIFPLILGAFRKYSGLIAVRIGIPVISSVFIWALFRLVAQNQYFGAYSRQLYKDWGTITVALGIFATLHALVFAFCLWKAMSDFDNLKNSLRDEANKILSISALLRFFDNVKKGRSKNSLKKIRKNLALYVENMVADAGRDVRAKNSALLNACVDHVEFLEIEHKNDEIALEGVVQGFSELIMIRSHRISCLHNRMSPFLFLIIAIMSAAVIFMFFVRNPVGFNSNEFIIPVLTFVYSYLLVMLIDLDRPFDGFWKVSVDAFNDIELKYRKKSVFR